jgi:hypothetical protein
VESRSGLAGVERRAWLRFFEDGIWDVAIGFCLIGFGLPVLFDVPYLAAIGSVLAIILLSEVKRRLNEPRIGRAHFAPRRQMQAQRINILLAALVVIGGLTFLLFTWSVAGTPPDWVEAITSHFVLLLGLVWGLSLALAGWAVKFRRLIFYGALLAGSLLASDLAGGLTLGLALCADGAVILGIGLVFLVRFVRRYPRIEEGGELE